MSIHESAIISPSAQLGSDVTVGPYAVIEDHVEIGDECEIAAHVVVKSFTKLGRRNRVFEHATLGGEPQDVKFKRERSYLIIGDDNLIQNIARCIALAEKML